jgi:hypothetical protein
MQQDRRSRAEERRRGDRADLDVAQPQRRQVDRQQDVDEAIAEGPHRSSQEEQTRVGRRFGRKKAPVVALKAHTSERRCDPIRRTANHALASGDESSNRSSGICQPRLVSVVLDACRSPHPARDSMRMRTAG